MKLSIKLYLLIIFLILFFAVGYQSIFYFEIQKNIVDSRISEATSIIQLSTNEIKDSVYFLDYKTLDSELDNLKKNPLISNTYVMHPDGRIISDGTDSNESFNMVSTNNFIQTSIGSDILNIKIEENRIQLVSPIIIVDQIGMLYIDYSLLDVNQILNESILLLLFFAGGLSLIGIVAGLYISSSITKPIQNIQKISVELAKGNFDVSFDEHPSSTDEINELTKTLQDMSINIKKYQNQLLKSERFSAIGELSARIAHDIRNPLSIIKTSRDNLELLEDDPENFEKTLKRIDRAIDRISHQVEGVMDFVRDTKLKLESTSVIELINSIISEMIIPDEIKINLPANDVTIQSDKVKLNSLFSNLILNAIQSIDNKGTITIRISEESNNNIKIEIENDGPPIPEETIEKIFEPLFTTKQTGTGLGLASVKKIVEQHHGTISVKNDPVIFTVILPIEYPNNSK